MRNLKSEMRNPKPVLRRRELRGVAGGRGGEGRGGERRLLVMLWFSNSRTSFFGLGVGGAFVGDLLEGR